MLSIGAFGLASLLSVKALRTYLALPQPMQSPFRDATFRAYWAEDRDIGDERELRTLIEGAMVAGSRVDAGDILARCATPEIKQSLFDATQRAIDAGVWKKSPGAC